MAGSFERALAVHLLGVQDFFTLLYVLGSEMHGVEGVGAAHTLLWFVQSGVDIC